MKFKNSIEDATRIITDENHRFITDSLLSKLDGIEEGAEVNVPTNLGITGTGDSRSITSSTGNNVSIPIATTSNSGFFGTGDKTKLDGIATGAEVNQNAFSSVTSTGQDSVSSTSKTDELNIEAGSANVVVTTDNASKTISIDFVGGTYEYTAGSGLTLSELEFNLGTPSTITGSSINQVSSSSHNHAVSLNHGDLGSIGENDHHSRQHSMTNASDHASISANRIIGRIDNNGTPQELDASQVRSIINVESGAEVNQTISSGNGMNFTGGSGNVTITLGTPSTLDASSSNQVGTSSHTHNISTGTASGLSDSSTNTEGTSANLARADHTHAISGFNHYDDSDVDAHLSGGTGINYSNGTISINANVNNLNDVSSGTESNRDVLVYNSTNNRYENRALVEADISDLQHYTNSDVDSHLSGGTGINYSNGTISIDSTVATQTWVNSNFTDYDSSNFDTDFGNKNTDNLSEGTSNLYFTNARIDSHLSGGSGITYSLGTISLTGDSFNSSGDYANLRARATTKDDVGLGNVPNTNIAYSSTIPADAFLSTEVTNLRANQLANGSTPWTSNNYYDNSSVDAHLSGETDINYSNGTISHANTSSQASSNNSGRTYIQSVELDGRGHVTSLSTATETVVNTDTITRLRGTTSGTYTSGDITLAQGGATSISQNGSTITISSTNTTYTAGSGISLSGTTFSVSAGSGLTQDASGLSVNATSKSNWDSAHAHVSSNGSDHGYINQNVTTTGTPEFSEVHLGNAFMTYDTESACLNFNFN